MENENEKGGRERGEARRKKRRDEGRLTSSFTSEKSLRTAFQVLGMEVNILSV
jgi:hypothetical protein